MPWRSLLLLLTLTGASVLAGKPSEIELLVGRLMGEDPAKRAEAREKLRALRATALEELALRLERAKDPELRRRLALLLEPDHLKPKAHADKAKAYGITEALDPILDGYLAGKQEARERLERAAPFAALGIELRLRAETDWKRRVKLRVAYHRALETTRAHADAVFKAAQGLHTVASNLGPFKEKWRTQKVARLRMQGKLLHWCFIEPDFYGRALDRDFRKNSGMFLPYRDLPAAADLYDLAQSMYAALAKAAKTPEQAAKLEEAARLAAAGSAECRQIGRGVK